VRGREDKWRSCVGGGFWWRRKLVEGERSEVGEEGWVSFKEGERGEVGERFVGIDRGRPEFRKTVSG